VRRRVIISLGLLLALFVIGSVTAIVSLHRSTHKLSALAELHRIQSLRERLSSAGIRVKSDLLAEMAGQPQPNVDPAGDQQRLAESLDKCGTCHHEPNILRQLNEVRDTFAAYRKTVARLRTPGSQDGSGASRQEAFQAADRLVDQVTTLVDRAGKHLSTRSSHAAIEIRRARNTLYATLAASLILGGIVAVHLKRRLTKPLEALLDGIERIRRGDTTDPLPFQGDEEFRRLASAFNDAYADLKAAHNSILHAEKLATAGRMSAGIAHEVLNPLASISSVVQVMRSRTDSAEQKEQIGLILKETARISNVLRDLQTFARPPKAQSPTSVRIDELLDYAIGLVAYDQRAQRVAIKKEIEPNIGPVLGDSDRLLLAFMNLMVNALDGLNAKDNCASVLTISARDHEEHVEISIRDNGVGMSERQITRAFDPFFTTKPPGAGTGLGLWICKQVIKGHGGTIRLDSHAGAGTTVTITLPCEQEPALAVDH